MESIEIANFLHSSECCSIQAQLFPVVRDIVVHLLKGRRFISLPNVMSVFAIFQSKRYPTNVFIQKELENHLR